MYFWIHLNSSVPRVNSRVRATVFNSPALGFNHFQGRTEVYVFVDVGALLKGQQKHEHHIDDNQQHHNNEHNNLLSLWGKVAAQHGIEEPHPLPAPPP